jgi:hypothetical protein
VARTGEGVTTAAIYNEPNQLLPTISNANISPHAAIALATTTTTATTSATTTAMATTTTTLLTMTMTAAMQGAIIIYLGLQGTTTGVMGTSIFNVGYNKWAPIQPVGIQARTITAGMALRG